MSVLVVTTARAREALAPLLSLWDAEVVVRDAFSVPEMVSGHSAVLCAGPRARSPRTVLPGPAVTTADGRVVPVAWLPDTGFADVRRFAETARAVHERASRGTSMRTAAVLAQRHARYESLAHRIVRLLGEEQQRVCRWTAHDVHRDDMVGGLSRGPALAVYVGHGRPIGWAGYAGVRAHHLGPAAHPRWRPSAAVLSLACNTASRRRTGLSFSEALPLGGVTAAALGAVGPTLFTANARWAVRITRALPGVRTIGELVAAVAPADPGAGAYRLIGDPTVPLADDCEEAA
jgi:hypothetical protein